jgi:hypothetical protein
VTAKRAPAPTKKAAKPKRYTATQTAQYNALKKLYPFKNTPYKPAAAKPAAPAPKRSAAGLAVPGDWIVGGNDELPSCVAASVANSLLSVTGIRVSDADVLELHELADLGDGVSISDVLSSLMLYGIGGHQPARVMNVGDALAQAPGSYPLGLVIGVTDGVNDHAVTWTPQGLISWGAPLSESLAHEWFLDGEAWFIDWRGEVN